MMRFSTTVLALIYVLLTALQAGAASNPGAQHLANLIGTWHCTYRSGGQSVDVVAVGTRLNGNWVQLKSERSTTLATYDAKRKQWVQFSATPQGNYSLATSGESPTAASLTWRVQYPNNMRGGRSTISWPSSTKRVIRSSSMVNGKRVETNGTCSKL